MSTKHDNDKKEIIKELKTDIEKQNCNTLNGHTHNLIRCPYKADT
jgi:hypothetical protein